MTKLRTPIPANVAAEVEFLHDRTCCVCRQRGQPNQIHHIDDDPSHHDPNNLAVLCLSCHDQTQIRGGFARRLTAEVIRRYRSDWVAVVARGRAEAERLLTSNAKALRITQRSFVDPDWTLGEQPELAAYLDSLPDLLAATRLSVRIDLDSGVTQKMVEGSTEIAAILQRIWIRLSHFFPEGHFGRDPAAYLCEHLDNQLRWYRTLIEPDGPGTGGTIIRILVSGEFVSTSAKAVEDIAMALLGLSCNADEANHWLERWRAAVAPAEVEPS